MNILKLSEIKNQFGDLSNSKPLISNDDQFVYVYEDDLQKSSNSDWDNSVQETGPDYTFFSFFDGINKIWHLFKVKAIYRNRIKTSSGVVELESKISNLIAIKFDSSFNEHSAFTYKMEVDEAKAMVELLQKAIKDAEETK